MFEYFINNFNNNKCNGNHIKISTFQHKKLFEYFINNFNDNKCNENSYNIYQDLGIKGYDLYIYIFELSDVYNSVKRLNECNGKKVLKNLNGIGKKS